MKERSLMALSARRRTRSTAKTPAEGQLKSVLTVHPELELWMWFEEKPVKVDAAVGTQLVEPLLSKPAVWDLAVLEFALDDWLAEHD
jgi:hypothetical protein